MSTIKRILSSISSKSSHVSDLSYTDTYFKEIGFKLGENSCLGSTESPDLDGEEISFYKDGFLFDEERSEEDEENSYASNENDVYEDEGDIESEIMDIDKITSLQDELNDIDIIAQVRIEKDDVIEENKKRKRLFPSTKGIRAYSNKYLSFLSHLLRADKTCDGSPEYSLNKSNHNLKIDESEGFFVNNQKSDNFTDMNLQVSHTHSTLENQHDTVVGDDAEGRTSVESAASAMRRRWTTIKFLFVIGGFWLIFAIVVIVLAFHDAAKNDNSVDSKAGEGLTQISNGWDILDLPTSTAPEFTAAHHELLAILTTVSPSSNETIYDYVSPQFKAFDWLAQSADLQSFSIQRLIQRWVLAIMFLTINGDSWSSNSETMNTNAWMSDTHECSWFSTHSTEICDAWDRITIISLGHVNARGTLPSELGLLSSIKHIYMPDNNILGTIPSELSELTKLELLQLSSNQITGEIPKSFGDLSSLVTLKLHRNQLAGPLPFQLGNLQMLNTLQVNHNHIKGTIPVEFFGIFSLETISLESNRLSGQIPAPLLSLPFLSSLTLQNNKLTGTMPFDSCNLSLLSADCDQMICECCTECFVEGESIQIISPMHPIKPTSGTTMRPTTFPSLEPSTASPTVAPTMRLTTLKPTLDTSAIPIQHPTTMPTISS